MKVNQLTKKSPTFTWSSCECPEFGYYRIDMLPYDTENPNGAISHSQVATDNTCKVKTEENSDFAMSWHIVKVTEMSKDGKKELGSVSTGKIHISCK